MSIETDIVVIGAGAAGFAAGEALAKAGARFLVLEAGVRRGGRAWTDFETFDGIAFDRGCHWLHTAAENPLRPIADALGYRYDTEYSYEHYALFEDGRRLDDAAVQALADRVDAAFERIDAMPAERAAAEALDPADPAYALFDHYIGLDFSHPATAVSAGEVRDAATEDDEAQYDEDQDDEDHDDSDEVEGQDDNDEGDNDEVDNDEDEAEENFPVYDGLGALIGALGAHVPVTLGAAVRTVARRGDGFRLATTIGEVEAKAVIVTVSTTVLASGGVRFEPELPPTVRAAIAACPVGCAEKVAFLLDAPLDALPARLNVHAWSGEAAARRPVSFNAHCGDPRLVVAMVAGAYAEALVAEGDDAVGAFVLDELVRVAGADVRGRVIGRTVTAWRRDPLFLGAYSAMTPGDATMRAVLSEPFDDRLLLAGEATAGDWFATVHGARRSGFRAAQRALDALGHV